MSCVSNCTPGSLTAIGVRGIYVVKGGEAASVVFYRLDAYLGHVLAVLVALYVYALALIASGTLEKIYRGLKIAIIAGIATTALSVFTAPWSLSQRLRCLHAVCLPRLWGYMPLGM